MAVISLFAAVQCGAADKAPPALGQRGDMTDSGRHLVGKVTKDQLFETCPAWRESASKYVAKPDIIEKLHRVDKPVDIVLFFGTWCKDSRSEVPKFLSILDAADNRNFVLDMHAVDRTKRDKEGLCDKFRINRVPTMVFLRDGKELGRIVEYPKTTVEEDFLAIVTGPR
jgi:thiol-disulfide isomerase/thioredoxin